MGENSFEFQVSSKTNHRFPTQTAISRTFLARDGSGFCTNQTALGKQRHDDETRIEPYQVKRRANWNWRGSPAAVGVPAEFQMGFTAITLNLLTILNKSMIPCSCILSPSLIERAMRRSLKNTYGDVPALRDRLPIKVGTCPVVNASR